MGHRFFEDYTLTGIHYNSVHIHKADLEIPVKPKENTYQLVFHGTI